MLKKSPRWTGFVTPSTRSFLKNEGTENADGSENVGFHQVTNPVQQQGVSVLIVGGFHSRGIADILRAKGISYSIIMPRITTETDTAQKAYTQRVLEQAHEMGLITNILSRGPPQISSSKSLSLISSFRKGQKPSSSLLDEIYRTIINAGISIQQFEQIIKHVHPAIATSGIKWPETIWLDEKTSANLLTNTTVGFIKIHGLYAFTTKDFGYDEKANEETNKEAESMALNLFDAIIPEQKKKKYSTENIQSIITGLNSHITNKNFLENIETKINSLEENKKAQANSLKNVLNNLAKKNKTGSSEYWQTCRMLLKLISPNNCPDIKIQKRQEIMSKIFREFDRLLSNHTQLKRIKTIGYDTYMLAGDFTSTNEIKLLAGYMQNAINDVTRNSEIQSWFDMAVNSGDVFHLMDGDIYHQTVNTAARLLTVNLDSKTINSLGEKQSVLYMLENYQPIDFNTGSSSPPTPALKREKSEITVNVKGLGDITMVLRKIRLKLPSISEKKGGKPPPTDVKKVNPEYKEEQGTVLYSDIVDSVNITKKIGSQSMVEIRERLFKEFDNIVNEYKNFIRKLPTQGDAYILASGIDNKEHDPNTVFKITFQMNQAIQKINKEFTTQLGNQKIQMRFGIDTGQIGYGKLGIENAPLTISGPTVFYAQKLEQEGKAGQTHISPKAKNVLKLTSLDKKRDSFLIPAEFSPVFFDPNDKNVNALQNIKSFDLSELKTYWEHAIKLQEEFEQKTGIKVSSFDILEYFRGEKEIMIAETFGNIFSTIQYILPLPAHLFRETILKQIAAQLRGQEQKQNLINQAFTAVSKNDVKTLQFLLENKLVDVDAQQNEITLLHEAARNKNQEVAILLLVHGADYNFPGPLGVTTIVLIQNNIPRIHTIIKETKQHNYSLLHAAIEKGYIEIVKALINAKADVNAEDAFGYTALHMAAENGHDEVVRALIEAKANVNTQNNNKDTALLLAVQNENINVVRALIEAKTDVDIENQYNWTALTYARLSGSIEILKLVAAKASQETKNEELIITAKHGNSKIVNALIEAKADVDAKDENGDTALIVAVQNGNINVVKTLIKAEADVNAQDIDGDTALMVAAKNRHIDVVKALLNTANINLDNVNNLNELIELFYKLAVNLDINEPMFAFLQHKNIIAFIDSIFDKYSIIDSKNIILPLVNKRVEIR